MMAKKGLELLQLFRSLHTEMTSTAVSVFLTVASNEGITMKDLGNMLGLSQSSCSRNVTYFSKYQYMGKDGLGLIIATEDPRERRRKTLVLTEKGKKLLEKIKKI